MTQRGSVLPIALVLLIALALAAVGLMKSVDTSTLLARNTSFQRDAINRNEVVMRQAIQAFETGAHFGTLNNTTRHADGVASNLAYRATALPTDAQGVPVALRTDAAFAAMFGAPSAATLVTGDGMTTTFVIDRLCTLEEPAAENHCVVSTARSPDNCSRCAAGALAPFAPIFRVSARTVGPRGVEAFSQTSFTLPILE